MRGCLAIGLALMLSACSTAVTAPANRVGSVVPASVVRVNPAASLTMLDRVMGKDARSLVSLFGAADQDVQEAEARKLQFGSAICIIDAYLYAPGQGKEPVVTYIDARAPDGKDVDRATCVSALAKR